MIDLKLFREHPTLFRDAAASKNVTVDVDRILDLDRRVRSLKSESEGIKAQKNEASKRISKADGDERKGLIEEMRLVDRRAESLTAELAPLEEELNELLYRIPNPPLEGVRIAKDDSENQAIRVVGTIPVFDFTPKDHLELGEQLGIIDTERAAKVSGARFTYFVGQGALLEMALVDFAVRTAIKYGFTPVTVPHLVTAKAMRAMGYLEHGGHDEIYYLPKDNLYLIGTSEQSIGPMHTEEILDAKRMPLRYVGISPCYRRESGSYGKDTKGIIRLHQFTKVEMFSFCGAEVSAAEHELMLKIEEELMQALGLPYHVLDIVSGDLGLPAAKKWDIEAWFPSQERYRETHSTSNCTDFQARRLNTRVRKEEGIEFVHTVNGTAFSGRPIAAILENFQQADGTVIIPEVLRAYMGTDRIIPRV
ncbi:MAG: Serine-tRNA ligase [Candidatus Uhrbacteria bacterium GW2011_GWD2_52_7]|uniref:Serine--tRNA ligase n=1 Tax=Candidatus Uhrbacteria bacterium GW2011_GWD2_52_7 TaxID=1618989 RepID=A0A0G1ZLS0_9BACT|nr:MAG: Serine-tRNA ligase [Candidatus Uhrbacteria bacterium GW2011_GWD2_52_7]